MERVQLKEKAKELLRGNYTPLILGLLVFVIAGMLGTIMEYLLHINYLSYVFSYGAEILFMMGYVNSIMKTARGEKVDVENVFNHTNKGLKYLILTLIIGLVIGFLFLLMTISFKSLSTVLLNINNVGPILFIILVIFGTLLSLAIFAFIMYLSLSFSQVYFILNDEPEENILEILNKSFDMMEGYRFKFLVFSFSFFGWILLGMFTFGILYLWLIPYMMVASVLFYEQIKDRYSYTAPLKSEEILSLDEENTEKTK